MAEKPEEPSNGMTQPSREKPQWGKKLSQKCKAAWRRCKEEMGRLFVAIAIWVVLAIGAFLVATWWLGRVLPWQLKLDSETQAESIVKIVLTLVGGVGAVAYLVIKYQERQQAGRDEERAKREEDREKDRLVNTKMQDAVDQLGSDRASTRIAGVYALTDVADTCGGGYRQRVVDILCGYLRSDREAYLLGADGKPATDQPRPGDADKAVESTIFSVMRDHLRKERRNDKTGEPIVRQAVDDDQLWCDCAFDLHGATFHEAVDLTYSTFECVPCFRGTEFERRADFRGAHFAGGAYFDEAHFAGGAYFHEAHFAGDADFEGARFAVRADFEGARFAVRAHFAGDAHFEGAHFAVGADFEGARFAVRAHFEGARFAGGADFRGARFAGGADFRGARFAGSAYFRVATFTGSAHFGGATFTGIADFSWAHFKGDADFGGATFKGDAYFYGARFAGDADFSWAEFRASAAFSGIQGQPSFGFEACKFNRKFRGTNAYEWGPIPIPEDNDGLPAGAVWKDFQEEDGKDGGTTNR